MKYLKQFSIILAITIVGEYCHYLLPFPVPAGIYGMFLLLILLLLGIIKFEQIKETSLFLLDIMPILFVEPAVSGLLLNGYLFYDLWMPLMIIILTTTAAVIIVAGHTTQFFIRHGKAQYHLEHKNDHMMSKGESQK